MGFPFIGTCYDKYTFMCGNTFDTSLVQIIRYYVRHLHILWHSWSTHFKAGIFWPLFGHRRRLDLPKYWVFGKILPWVSIKLLSFGLVPIKFLSFGLSFQKLLEYLSKSFKITLIHLQSVLHISLLATFVLGTCRIVEFLNKKSLSFGAKILEFEFLGPWVFWPKAKKNPWLNASAY